MCDQIKNASLEWQDERTPISIKFDEPYFSIFNGLDETRHVFLSQDNCYDWSDRSIRIDHICHSLSSVLTLHYKRDFFSLYPYIATFLTSSDSFRNATL